MLDIDRSADSVGQQDRMLQCEIIRDILYSYLTYGKGGTHDRNGRLHHNRGGSKEAASACGYCQTYVARRGTSWLQDQESMAHQGIRLGAVSSRAQAQDETRTGKLNVLPVAHLLPNVSQALSSRFVYVLPHAIFAYVREVVQVRYFLCTESEKVA